MALTLNEILAQQPEGLNLNPLSPKRNASVVGVAPAIPTPLPTQQEPQQEPATPTATDYGKILGASALETAAGIPANILNIATGGYSDELAKQISGQGLSQRVAQNVNDLRQSVSPAMQASQAKTFVNTDGGELSLGDAWQDPHAIASQFVNSAPAMAATMVPAIRAGKVASAGLTGEAAAQAAGQAGMVSGMKANAVVAGSLQAQETEGKIRGMNEAQLANSSPEYNDLRASGLSHEQAQDDLARKGGAVSFALGGAGSSVSGAYFDKFLGRLGAGEAGNRLSAAAKGLTLNVPGEMVQEGVEQASTNLGIKSTANPQQSLTQDVPNAMAAGGVMGGLQGGGSGLLLGGQQSAGTNAPIGEVSPELQQQARERTARNNGYQSYEEMQNAYRGQSQSAQQPAGTDTASSANTVDTGSINQPTDNAGNAEEQGNNNSINIGTLSDNEDLRKDTNADISVTNSALPSSEAENSTDSTNESNNDSSLVVKKDGKPFASEAIAKSQLAVKGLSKTHSIKPVEGGFALKPNEPTKSTATTEDQSAEVKNTPEVVSDDNQAMDTNEAYDAGVLAGSIESVITDAPKKVTDTESVESKFQPTHIDPQDNEPYQYVGGTDYIDSAGNPWAFEDGELDAIPENKIEEQSQEPDAPRVELQDNKLPVQDEQDSVLGSESASEIEPQPISTTTEATAIPAEKNAVASNENSSNDLIDGLLKRPSDNQPFADAKKAQQALRNNPSLKNDEHDIVPVSGGYAIAPTKNLSYDQYKSLPRNSGFTENLLAQSYEAETGKTPESSNNGMFQNGTNLDNTATNSAIEIDQAAQESATSKQNDLPQPTQAQKEAGNYKKGKIRLNGMDISIENPRGSERSGVDTDGKPWSVTMQHHYGYIKGTVGNDGDHVDVFIGKNPASNKVFVVNQIDPKTGKFDEHKSLMGFNNIAEAKAAYQANYAEDWKGGDDIVEMSMDEFKSKVKSGVLNKPIKQQSSTQAAPQAEQLQNDRVESSASQAKTEGFKAIHPNSQKLFNDAFDSRNAESLGEMLHNGNINLRAEFKARTGVSLPRTVKGTKEAITNWSSNEATTKSEVKPVSPDIGTSASGNAPTVGSNAEVAAVPSEEKEYWQMTSDEYLQYRKENHKSKIAEQGELIDEKVLQTHKRIIKSAIDDGSKVPSHVREEYPDLDIAHTKKVLAEVESKLKSQGMVTNARDEDQAKMLRKKIAEYETENQQSGNKQSNIQKFNPEHHIKLAADSIDKLRKQDVYRLFESIDDSKNLVELRKYIFNHRSDLKDEVDIVIDELLQSGSTQPQNVSEPAEEVDTKPQPSENKIFTEDAAEKARAILKAKLGQLNSGIDPEIMQAGITLAGYHIEKGARSFVAYSKAMLDDLGDVVKPYLKSWYMGVKFDPRAASFDGMDSASDVESFNIDSLDQQEKPVAPKESPRMVLANDLSNILSSGKAITSKMLYELADKHFGGTQAQGTYSPKDAYDAMEVAVNLYLMHHDTGINAHGNVSAQVSSAHADTLKNFINERLPTQTRRDSEMDEFQQFSTPPALAYVANWVANITKRDVMAEPSAGTGDLVVWADNAGAELILNELSPRRAELLKELFPKAHIFTENAEQLNNVLPKDEVPSVIVMNPPFSSTAGRLQGQRDTMNGAKHIEQALKRLQPGGRLVAIVGNGMAADKPAFKGWWQKIAQEYNVRANIGISGKDYAKYGTTFDNNILVIDKTGATTGDIITGNVESASKLPELLEGIRNDRKPIESKPAKYAGQKDSTANGLEEYKPNEQSSGSGSDAMGSGKPINDGSSVGNTRGSGGNANGTRKKSKATNEPANQDGQRGQYKPDAIEGTTGSGDGTVGAASGITESGISVDSKESEKIEGELSQSVFADYKPQRLSIPGAKPHPGNLVQSAAMSAVEPPKPTYTPNLPKEVITEGKLSIAQLEAVVYAGQAHQELLPNGERRGFFIGDGTGVGKGREISGIILDNLRQGRKKAVWISFNEKLINDAQRDFSGVGGDKDKIFWHGKTKAGNELSQKYGILFTTYSTLQSAEKKQANDQGQKQGKSRLEQIVKWLGEDFDGVIAFDEAHSMGNAIQMKGKRGVKKPSLQALAGVNLQQMLPKARIVYVSATGATEVSNLAYASRLGLWGEGTPFPNATSFINEISHGGVAAMELIARDMKALGMYIARSLSFEGVTYQRLEHELTPLQNDIYNELAKAWQIVLQNVEDALDITNSSSSAKVKSAALSAFWGAHQRFFNQVITSLQTPTVIDDIQKQIDAGKAVVIQLVNTNEATQEREAAKASANGIELEELDFTPRQMLMDYVKNSFPVQAYEEYEDDNGNKGIRVVKDADGNPVFDQDAIAKREKLLEDLEFIRVPENPIDAIINAFGSDNVGEVTGRKRRFVQTRDEEGNLKVVEEKRGKHAAQSDSEAFQGDKKPILIFSQAGGTGFSFHADNSAVNQRPRVHYILQPGWRADSAVQGFGRTHRTNQKQPPHYVLPTTNLKAQKRFVSSIARRLDQLGALTRGQRQAANQGMFSASDNLESRYASEALEAMFIEMYQGTNGLNFHEVTKSLGLTNLIDKDTGGLNYDKIPEIPQFLNRLLSLQSHEQDEVFTVFENRMNEIVDRAIQKGTYDSGMQTLEADSLVKTRDELAHTDKRTGSETRYVELDATYPTQYRSWAEAVTWSKAYGKDFVGWFTGEYGAMKGKVFGLANLGNRTNSKGITTESGVVILINKGKQKDTRYIDNVSEIKKGTGSKFNPATRKYEDVKLSTKIDADKAREMWEQEVDASPKSEVVKERMLVGVILPIWDRIKGSEKIYRLRTDEGEQMIGRHLSKESAKDTLKNLGLGSEVSTLTTQQLIDKIRGGERALLANGWEIKQSLVSGEKRIEIIHPRKYFSPMDAKILKDQGVFSERIQWEERYFLPTGSDLKGVFERVTSSRPVVDFVGSRVKIDEGGNETPLDQEISFSKASIVPDGAKPRGITENQADAIISRFLNDLNGIPGAKHLKFSHYATIKDAVPTYDEKGRVKGFYRPASHEIAIIRDSLDSVQDTITTLRHEVCGHFGLNILKPEDKRTFLEKIISSKKNPVVNSIFSKVEKDYPKLVGNDMMLAEEVFAEIAGETPSALREYADNMIAALFKFFRGMGFFHGVATVAELRQFAKTIAQSIKNGARQRTFPKSDGEQFSQSTSATGGNGNNEPPIDNNANADSESNPDPSNHESLLSRAWSVIDDKRQKGLAWMETWDALGNLPEKKQYLIDRYRTLGNLAKVEEISKSVYDTFAKASKDDAEAIYRYLTTKDATIDEIHNVMLRKGAKDVKQAIMAVGQQLVDRGFLDKESHEKYKGMYLPRVYLKHILGDDLFTALGSGKTPSDLGYLKKRQDIPEEVRRLILMEIKDPAYLAGRALNLPMRDIAIFDWFSGIADNAAWVWKQSYATVALTPDGQPEYLIMPDGKGVSLLDPRNPNQKPVDGEHDYIAAKQDKRFKTITYKPIKVKPTSIKRKVTPYYLSLEAERMRKQAHAAPEQDRADILALADTYEQFANAMHDAMGASGTPKDFVQMPKSKRYGALAGLVVRKEIHDDIVGTSQIFQGDPSTAQKILGDGGALSRYTSFWKFMKVAANPPSHVRNIMSNLVLLHLSGVDFHKVPQRVFQAVQEIMNGGEHWEVAKKYGVTQSTFANTELFRMNRELNDLVVRNQDSPGWDKVKALLHLKSGNLVDKLGDWYQFMEAVGKTAKIIDEMEKGAKPEDAAIAAHEALFDYSLVSQNVRYMRNSALGTPFACVDEDTKMLTQRGWLSIDEVIEGDIAASFNMETELLEWKPVIGVFRSEYGDKELIHFKDRHIDMFLTPDHKCVTYKIRRVVGKRIENKKYLSLEIQHARDLNQSNYIPTAANFVHDVEETIDDNMVKLVGWHVTEGTCHSKCGQITISQNEGEDLEDIRSCINELGFTTRESSSMFKNGNALHVFVNIHSKYGKIVRELTPGKQLTPEFLMKLSLRQIKILVDTMIKGDGSFNKKSGRKSFTQNKGKTLETFKMALTMLGISYQDLDKDDKCRHISIRSGKNYCIKRATIERKIYSGRVWCPNIDGNHTWVAMRNGKPFITHNSFYVKALPQLIKVATTHPGRFLPYVLTFKALGMLVAAQNDVDDDDLDKLKKALPEWLQEKGHAYILPVKDAFGRWQAIDLGYFVPWTMYTELLGEAGRGDIGGAMRSLGVLGSPVADLITAVKTGIDPFTRKPIVDKFGTPAEQMGDIFNYLWRMNMPTFITDIGATGKLIEAISGDVDKQGNPKTTVGQALARFAGVNLYGIDPENERAKNIRHRRYEMIEAKAAWRKAVRDPNASESDKENASEHYRELIGDMATDLQQYLKDSEIHPNLKLQKTGV